MEPENFWDSIRDSLFKGRMTQGVVDTIDSITDTYIYEAMGQHNSNHLAYCLSTAYHESYSASKNPEWEPPREGFAKTNEGAVRAVTKLYDQKKISTNYALPDAVTGLSYYGRSFIQTTWKRNYEKMGDRIGLDLVNKPDLLLERPVAAKALVIGMLEGIYTGKKLEDYNGINGSYDFVRARRIVNGLDKAELIAGYANKFLTAINLSKYGNKD